MANVLKDEKKQQIIALGRQGWSLRKIQETTRVRRETISAYLLGVGEAQSGKYRRTRLFVLTLGHSRRAIRLLTFPIQYDNRGWVESRLGTVATWRSKRSSLSCKVACNSRIPALE